MHKITLIRGDGIGPEVCDAMMGCVEKLIPVEWDIQEAGLEVYEKEGNPLPASVIESIKRNKVAIKGPVTTPLGSGFRSANITLRMELDLFACIRPCRYYQGAASLLANPSVVDLVIIRENTEDLYAGIEFKEGEKVTHDFIRHIKDVTGRIVRDDSAISIKPISVFGTERIVKYAFDYAVIHNRKKVTSITKSNIMKCTDGLFQRVAAEVAKQYPQIEYEHKLIDNMCMQLVQRPQAFDVLVLPNLYGDIVSDLVAGLIGGLGVAPGANVGSEYAVFEAAHGSAPEFKGLNKLNPTALILSAVLMLRHLNENQAADRLEQAVKEVLLNGKDVTCDINPDNCVGTREMAQSVINKL